MAVKIKALESIYTKSFFSSRHRLKWRVPIVCDAVKTILNPSGIVDVGCAVGDYVRGFTDTGMDAAGIEGSESSLPYLQCASDQVFFADLRKPLPNNIPCFDLAMCFEVAEHIEPEFARMFAENLERLSDRILMSAATPGQGGHYHVNCQPHEYWIDMFANTGYRMNENIVAEFRTYWKPWQNKKEMSSYYKNLLFFEVVK